MASSFRSSWGKTENNIRRPLNPQQPVLAVAPLNSVPYTGPPLSCYFDEDNSPPSKADPELQIKNQTAVVFLPSNSTDVEWKNVLAATKGGVGITGSAALGTVGRPVGLIDIGESVDTYVYRVSLPGVPRDRRFKCSVEPNGKIMITGTTSTGEKRVHKNNMVFEMQSQNLSPPGEFSVSFHLPGPISEKSLNASFGKDGIYQGVVKKRL